MLRKLIKYDIKATVRTAFILDAAIILAIILSAVTYALTSRIFSASNEMMPLIAYFSPLFAFSFGMAAAVGNVVAAVFILIRFYNHLMTDQGYLSFTLPVTATEHMVSKTVTAVLFIVIQLIADAVGLFLGVFLYKLIAYNMPVVDIITSMWESIKLIFSDIPFWKADEIAFTILFVLNTILTGFSLIFEAYFAMTIAGIAKRAKFIAGFGVFIGSYWAVQSISSIGSIALFTTDALTLMLLPPICIHIAVIIVLYNLTRKMIGKSLNLN